MSRAAVPEFPFSASAATFEFPCSIAPNRCTRNLKAIAALASTVRSVDVDMMCSTEISDVGPFGSTPASNRSVILLNASLFSAGRFTVATALFTLSSRHLPLLLILGEPRPPLSKKHNIIAIEYRISCQRSTLSSINFWAERVQD